MPDLSSLLNCSYGASQMELWDYSVNETPVLKDGVGRIFTKVTVKLDCRVVCYTGNAGDFAGQLAAVLTAVRMDGQDLIVTGIAGAEEYSLLAAQCMEGGQHVTIDGESVDGPSLQKKLTLTVQSNRFDPTQQNGPTDSYKVATAVRADGLKTYTRTGDVIGPNASDYFLAKVLPPTKAAHGLPFFVVTFSYESSVDGNLSKTSYVITAVETHGPLPYAGPASAVDGDMSIAVERDEHYRKTTTFSFDLLIGDTDDAITILTKLRTDAQGPGNKRVLLREKWENTLVKENRLRGSFTVLEGADGTPLMNWTEQVSIKSAEDGWDVHTYPGAAPVVVRRPMNVVRISQSGSAIGAGQYKVPPTWLSDKFLGGAAEVTISDENDVEKKTTWKAESFPALGSGDPDQSYELATIPTAKLSRKQQDDKFMGGPPPP